MATEAQIAANRRNARHSTGPKTDAGKETSSQNAMKFGLFARHVLLPGEDESQLAELRDGIRARLKPADALEAVYVERIVTASWRLQRALAHEAHCYVNWHEVQQAFHHPQPHNDAGCSVEQLAAVQKHIASLERSIDKAVFELSRLQKARRESQEVDLQEEDLEVENEPDRPEVAEVRASLPVELVKTNPIATASNVSDDVICENEPNPPAPQARQAHGSAVGPGCAPDVT